MTDPNPADVTAEWRELHLPTVFSRWHDHIVRLQQATIAAVVAAAAVEAGDAVLDVGCGSGIPSLALAAAVGPTGRVTATDPSPVFVAAVTENARRLGVRNLDAVQTSAAGLPFPPASFDAATCHMGAMFFPDLGAGLGRIRETLRPGAWAAFVAWGPDAENTFFGSFWGAAAPHLPPNPEPPVSPTPDTPRPGRFADPGSLGAALAAAGFNDVREEAPLVALTWPGDPASLLRFWLELSGAEERVPASGRAALRADVLATFARFRDGDALRFGARVVVASGRAR